MVDNVLSTNTTSTGFIYSLGASDTLLVTANASAVKTTTQAAASGPLIGSSTNSSQSTAAAITNLGSLSSRSSVIWLFGGGATINNTGEIVGFGPSAANAAAIKIFSSNNAAPTTQIVNDGLIRSYSDGAIDQDGAGELTIRNTGTIGAGASGGSISNAVRMLGADSELQLLNSGLIAGSIFSQGATLSLNNELGGHLNGSVTMTAATGALNLTNRGDISGTVQTYGSTGSLFLTNYGLMTSGVSSSAQLNVYNYADIIGIIAGVQGQVWNYGQMGSVAFSGSSSAYVDNFAGGVMNRVETAFGADEITNRGVITLNISSGDGNDVIDTAGGRVFGGIAAGLGNDKVIGGDFNDVVYGDNTSGDTSGGADILYGGFGDDVLNGGYGADQLYGNQNDDVLYGNQDNDWLHGGQGADVVYGGQGNDICYGGAGDDLIYGNIDDDQLFGADGADIIYGGQGLDFFEGGAGDDALYGNLGDDTFYFAGPGFGHDVIGDFGNGADRIRVATTVFSSFADVQAHATQITAGVLLSDGAGDTILLIGATVGGLNAGQFIFG